MIPILMYHRIDDISPDQDLYPGMTMSPTLFETQMRYLAEHNFHCLSLSEVLQCQQGQMSVPKRPIAITFDDGYQDNYDNAWPILQKFNFTATIFLVAHQIGKTNNWDKREGVPAPPLMPLENIREMKEAGIDFGSHTLTHARLTDVSEEEAHRQISLSRQVLEERLDDPIRFFSYPYDRLNSDIVEIVAQSGYDGACGMSSVAFGPHNMWRVECLGSDSMALFRLKVSGLYDRLVRLRDQKIVKKITRKIKGRVKK